MANYKIFYWINIYVEISGQNHTYIPESHTRYEYRVKCLGADGYKTGIIGGHLVNMKGM